MMDTDKLFRDYATRVSFNMTLSRNQIHTLRCIVIDIELEARSFDDRILAKSEINRERVAHGFADNFIAGQRSITSMGLIQSDPRAAVENDRLGGESSRAARRAQVLGPGPSAYARGRARRGAAATRWADPPGGREQQRQAQKEAGLMAARRPARRGTAASKSALTPHQALAYGICAAFYGSGGCSCEKQGTGNVCANVTTAAVKARAIIEAENPK